MFQNLGEIAVPCLGFVGSLDVSDHTAMVRRFAEATKNCEVVEIGGTADVTRWSVAHVAVAIGRSYADVPPNRGVYRGDAEEKIHVSVSIQALSE